MVMTSKDKLCAGADMEDLKSMSGSKDGLAQDIKQIQKYTLITMTTFMSAFFAGLRLIILIRLRWWRDVARSRNT